MCVGVINILSSPKKTIPISINNSLPSTEYDIVYLLVAMELNGVHTDVDHDQMTAVIRYKTPYTINGNDPFELFFVLDNDVSLLFSSDYQPF